MIDGTLTQILNELFRLTQSVQQAAQEINQLEARTKELEEASQAAIHQGAEFAESNLKLRDQIADLESRLAAEQMCQRVLSVQPFDVDIEQEHIGGD